MPDHKKEWILRANVDYFSQFMTLWLAFNSWYRSHYPELGIKDRVLINRLKTDLTARNQLYSKFKNLMAEDRIKENGIPWG